MRGLYTEIMAQTDSNDLIQEIRYLEGLLDANGIAYDYRAYKESLRIAEVEDEILIPELTREHAIAFYSMFRGRKDVFAKRSAKKGYFTQCDNFWKYGVCPKWMPCAVSVR